MARVRVRVRSGVGLTWAPHIDMHMGSRYVYIASKLGANVKSLRVKLTGTCEYAVTVFTGVSKWLVVTYSMLGKFRVGSHLCKLRDTPAARF